MRSDTLISEKEKFIYLLLAINLTPSGKRRAGFAIATTSSRLNLANAPRVLKFRTLKLRFHYIEITKRFFSTHGRVRKEDFYASQQNPA